MNKNNYIEDRIKAYRREVWYPTPELKPTYEDVVEISEKFLRESLEQVQEKEIVICAAIKTKDGKVIRGHRHADAIFTARDREGYRIADLSFADQGFVTSRNRYVSREEGRKLQDAAGIISASPEGYMPGTLFSEDLY